MPAITQTTSISLAKGKSIIFRIGGKGSVTVDPTGKPNTYLIGSQEVFLGPYDRALSLVVSVESGSILYLIDDDGDLSDQGKINAAVSQVVTVDPVTGDASLSQFVISEDAPDDADGRPDGTIYLQVA